MSGADGAWAWVRELRVVITDENATSGITPAGLLDYLEAAGWTKLRAFKDEGIGEIWSHGTGASTVLVPLRPEYSDYGRRVLDVVSGIARVEGRGKLGVLMDLRGPGEGPE